MLVSAGCSRQASGPLPQRIYIWQRAWTPAVSAGVKESALRASGIVVLAAHLDLKEGVFVAAEPNIDWKALAGCGKPVALAIRISRYRGPFLRDDAVMRSIRSGVAATLAKADAAGLSCQEVQLDFDCADSKLDGYRVWLQEFKKMVAPRRAVFTILPSWLSNKPGFAALCSEADGFVLQVHSVDFVESTHSRKLCDTARAAKWVEAAGKFGVPFEVALPTYRSFVGFDPKGKFLGVVSEATRQQWPPGTTVAAYYSDAPDIAKFVRGLMSKRPAGLRGLVWFRMPVSTDENNWGWNTLSKVMVGEEPKPNLEIRLKGDNPVDISLLNSGDADASINGRYAVKIPASSVVFSEALPGWRLEKENGLLIASFSKDRDLRLTPGKSVPVGWVRLKGQQ